MSKYRLAALVAAHCGMFRASELLETAPPEIEANCEFSRDHYAERADEISDAPASLETVEAQFEQHQWLQLGTNQLWAMHCEAQQRFDEAAEIMQGRTSVPYDEFFEAIDDWHQAMHDRGVIVSRYPITGFGLTPCAELPFPLALRPRILATWETTR